MGWVSVWGGEGTWEMGLGLENLGTNIVPEPSAVHRSEVMTKRDGDASKIR